MTRWRLKYLFPGINATIRSLPNRIRRDVVEILSDLTIDPFPPYVERLRRELHSHYKIKVDGWRIIYSVEIDDHIVKIPAIRKRNANTYLNL